MLFLDPYCSLIQDHPVIITFFFQDCERKETDFVEYQILSNLNMVTSFENVMFWKNIRFDSTRYSNNQLPFFKNAFFSLFIVIIVTVLA